MVEHLVVVAAHTPQIQRLLSRLFAGSETVQVLVDRRRRERRQEIETRAVERRWVDRRRENPPRSDWFVIIRLRRPSTSRLVVPLWAQEKTTRRTETALDFDLWVRAARLVGVLLLALGVLLATFMGTTIALSVISYR